MRAVDCQRAGASGISFRLRDGMAQLSLDSGLWQAIMMEIGYRAPGLYVQLSLENMSRSSPDQIRLLINTLRPSAVSLSLRDLASTAHADDLGYFYHACLEAGIAVQHVLADHDEIAKLAWMIDDGVIPEEELKLLLHVDSWQRDDVSHVAPFIARLKADLPDADWALSASGPGDSACLYAAMMLGGKVRLDSQDVIDQQAEVDGILANGGQLRELVQMLGLSSV
ncbi:3-keto-5-aminohexanoate cleavage protein [Martelella alba]|nr:3-keto-5-aminohexanoate cleavage protein [Martelella alba]